MPGRGAPGAGVEAPGLRGTAVGDGDPGRGALPDCDARGAGAAGLAAGPGRAAGLAALAGGLATAGAAGAGAGAEGCWGAGAAEDPAFP